MKKGQASKTAEWVCIGRALAHGVLAPTRFYDPTAFELLPEEARRIVEGERSGRVPEGLGPRLRHEYLKTQAKLMVARTVAVDDDIRRAGSEQVVILGAGLDGRAWRMQELAQVSVFEVDHPDSQREKRERVAKLQPRSSDIRFVSVDFEHDALDAALAAAGHDETRTTTWVWEGVVMYLTPNDIEATLAVIRKRSAPRSTLIVVYHAPALILRVLGLFLKRIGEPLRSSFEPAQMRALLARYDFELEADRDVGEVGASLSPEIGQAARRVRHMRIATALKGSARPDSPRR